MPRMRRRPGLVWAGLVVVVVVRLLCCAADADYHAAARSMLHSNTRRRPTDRFSGLSLSWEVADLADVDGASG
jgi:hypothetical protein